MSTLRNKLIRLAHSNPELRETLLPLVKEASSPEYERVFQNAARAMKGKKLYRVLYSVPVVASNPAEAERIGLSTQVNAWLLNPSTHRPYAVEQVKAVSTPNAIPKNRAWVTDKGLPGADVDYYEITLDNFWDFYEETEDPNRGWTNAPVSPGGKPGEWR